MQHDVWKADPDDMSRVIARPVQDRVFNLPVELRDEKVAALVEAEEQSFGELLATPVGVTVGHGPGVVRTPADVADCGERCGNRHRTVSAGRPHPRDRRDAAPRRERDKVVAGQKEDVGVTHVIGERKHRVDAIREHDECAPRPACAPQRHGAREGEQNARYPELLAQVEEEHGQMIERLVRAHAKHHQLAPVRLGRVEPEPIIHNQAQPP